MSPDTMDLLIDWLYSDFKESLTFEQHQALFTISHKYDILELQQECERVLSSSVTLDTYAVLADVARHFGSQRIKQVRLCCLHCMRKLLILKLSSYVAASSIQIESWSLLKYAKSFNPVSDAMLQC